MQVSVTFRNMEATEGLKRYAREKVAHIQRYVNRPMTAHVVLFKERFRHVAEIVMTANGVPLKCMARDQDMYAAIDEAISKLDRQVRKYKEKRKEHRPPEVRRSPRARRAAALPAPVLAEPAAAPSAPPPIVRTDEYASKPLSPEQAVAEMQERGLPVLLFKNVRSKRVNVVYRRPDGTFGWIEGKARAR